MKFYKGEVLSEGIAVGKIFMPMEIKSKKSLGVKLEKEKLLKALDLSLSQIEDLKIDNQEHLEYLNVQKLLIEDYTLKDKALAQIEKGNSAVDSLAIVLNQYAEELFACHNGYLQERASDILDIKNRIIGNLEEQNDFVENQFILYTKELRPSFLIQNKRKLLGVITNRGGYSSHGAILCRQLNIPYMIASINALNGSEAIIDTRKQKIIINPDQKDIDIYKEAIKSLALEEYDAIPHNPYGFYANVSDNLEIDKVLKYHFDGIGLYRTEFIFMNDNRPYSYEEQYAIYHEAVLRLEGKPICFRTFDIGDDKVLPYVKSVSKGIDNYLNNPDLFETQVKALLMANEYDNMKIMFPMIKSNNEFVFLKNWVNRIKEKYCKDKKVLIGMMLETKEAINALETFKDVDFISLGTNDLVLSIYHIERDEQHIKMQKYIHHLLDEIKRIVKFCDQNHIELSICGELAAIELALREFIKVGVKNFSVASPAIRVLNKVYKDIS